ncbi:MAG: YerC/YecD family TrpR-related protein, partial [Gammaproteobacteria bacterium]
NFLTDLCTPNELKALEERWEVAKLLATNKYTYREISAKLGASTTTVTRVARFLFDKNNKGYTSLIKVKK